MSQLAQLWIKIGARLDGFDRGMSDMQRSMTKVGKKMERVGRKMSLMITAPILLMTAAVIKMGANFEQSMMNAASVSGATAKELEYMEKVARDMGATTVFSAMQAADALYFMASAGWKAAEMGVAIKPILDLAAATQSDLAFATDTVVASLNQFQLGAEGAERLTNVFAAAIGKSQATMEKLNQSMTYVGPIFNSMGKEVEEAAASLMLLFNAGFEASMAGTALRMGIAKLLKPTSETTRALKRLGLTIENVDPTTKHFADIIEILGRRGATTKDIIEIFGVRAGPAFAAMIAQGADKLREFEKGITGTSAAAEMADMQIDTLKGSMKLLTSALTEVAIQFSKILGPAIRDLIDNKIKPAVEWFSKLSEGKKKLMVVVAGLAAAFGPLTLATGKFLQMAANLHRLSPKLAKSIGKIGGAIGLLLVGLKAATYLFGKLSDAIHRNRNIKEIEKYYLDLEKTLGRSVGWKEFSAQAERAGLITKEFTKALEKNKWDILKTMDELEEGEIKHSDDLRALYHVMLKDKEALLAREEEIAEKRAELEGRVAERTESHTLAIDAQRTAQFALNNDLPGYLAHMEKIYSILGLTQEEREKEIAKLKETESGLGLTYSAIVLVNKALQSNMDLTVEEVERLESLRAQLEISFPVDRIKLLNTEFVALKTPMEILEKAVDDFKNSMSDFPIVLEEVPNTMDDVISSMVQSVFEGSQQMQDHLKDMEEEFKRLNKRIKIDWEKVADDMGRVWAESFAGMMDETKSFADFLNSTFDSLASGVSSILGEALTGLLKITGKMAGPIGAVFAGIISGALGMFKKLLNIKSKAEKEAEKAAAKQAQAERQFTAQVEEAKKVMSAYGEITDSTAKKIADARKEMDGFSAISLNFSDVIKDVGVNQGNLNALWSRTASIMDQMAAGEIDATKATEVLDDAFTQLKDGAVKFGTEGSAAMVSFILKTRELGVQVASVTDYVVGQLNRIPDALGTLIGTIPSVGSSLDELRKKLADQNKELAGLKVGTKEYEKLQKEILETNKLITTQISNIEEFSGDLERSGKIAVLTFKAMQAEGMSFSDAIKKLSGPLADLKEKYAEQGLEASGALAKMFKVVGVVEANKDLFDAIDANLTIMESLGNSAYYNEGLFKDFASQAVEDFETLRKKFGDDETALMAMGPTLQRLADDAETYGWTLDDNTQAIIDQAKKLGIVTETQESEQEQQERLFGDLGDRMADIMQTLGDTIEGIFAKMWPDAFAGAKDEAENARKGIEGAFDGMEVNIPVGFKGGKAMDTVDPNQERVYNPGGEQDFGDWGGFASGGAFIPSGPTPITVHAGELVDITPIGELRSTGKSRAGLGLDGEAPNITIVNEMEPIIIQRDNEIVINIVKKGLDKGQLTVPIKAVGG